MTELAGWERPGFYGTVEELANIEYSYSKPSWFDNVAAECANTAENVSLFDVCTMETPLLYSHRRDKGNTGGMAAYLRIL